MSQSNDKTLQSYASRLQAFVDGTAPVVGGEVKDWIDALLAGLTPSASILEIGSAFGRDAAYIQSRGFTIHCTDAVAGFVELLRARGFEARLFNILTDAPGRAHDLIFANAVLLHFTHAEFASALAGLRAALVPGGRLAFSLKRGRGEEWSSAKLGAPRYFHYWEPDDLPPLLRAAGFAGWDIAGTRAGWLFVAADAPCVTFAPD